MNLRVIENTLKTVMVDVYHYDAGGAQAPYVVWAEEGQKSSMWADDKIIERTITGSIDYFTKNSEDEVIKKIEVALNGGEITWYLESVQYEDDTGLYHYEWVWEIWQE